VIVNGNSFTNIADIGLDLLRLFEGVTTENSISATEALQPPLTLLKTIITVRSNESYHLRPTRLIEPCCYYRLTRELVRGIARKDIARECVDNAEVALWICSQRGRHGNTYVTIAVNGQCKDSGVAMQGASYAYALHAWKIHNILYVISR